MKFAVIDIGSNSVRLMLWADGKTLYKKVETTRLGEGLEHSGLLLDVAIERTARTVAHFCEEGTAAGARVLAFATAAVRRGANGDVFCARVKEVCGLDVDVVSGEEEAQLGILGALGTEDGGIIDVGGASTEVCLRRGGETIFSVSMEIGAVRLYDGCREDRAKLIARIGEALVSLEGIQAKEPVYAIGGTASTLACLALALPDYDAGKLQHLPLTHEWVEDCAERLLTLPVEERRKLTGMDIRRADIIAGAALLLAEVMKKLSLPQVLFSDSDNLEGYLVLRGLQ